MSAERERMRFGALLDDLLGRAGMTQAGLARAVGVKPPAVWKWLGGQAPMAAFMPAILDALQASPEDRRLLQAAYARETSSLPTGDLSPAKLRVIVDALETIRGS